MLRISVWLACSLLALAVYDLRLELQLLADHFTLTTFRAAISSHPLAVLVLLTMPPLLLRRKR
ncbi:MAG TPA: hypothetical protein DDY43_02550 [Synechococcales bacterium UBA10510]|nr:hypothetical protein [Synechococcales bacterium UBA10510]